MEEIKGHAPILLSQCPSRRLGGDTAIHPVTYGHWAVTSFLWIGSALNVIQRIPWRLCVLPTGLMTTCPPPLPCPPTLPQDRIPLLMSLYCLVLLGSCPRMSQPLSLCLFAPSVPSVWPITACDKNPIPLPSFTGLHMPVDLWVGPLLALSLQPTVFKPHHSLSSLNSDFFLLHGSHIWTMIYLGFEKVNIPKPKIPIFQQMVCKWKKKISKYY